MYTIKFSMSTSAGMYNAMDIVRIYLLALNLSCHLDNYIPRYVVEEGKGS